MKRALLLYLVVKPRSPPPWLSPVRSESLAKKRAMRMASQASKEAGAPAS